MLLAECGCAAASLGHVTGRDERLDPEPVTLLRELPVREARLVLGEQPKRFGVALLRNGGSRGVDELELCREVGG